MADTKISALPASTTPLAGTEVLPIVQGGATKQVSVANLTAGRAISATELTLTTGNLIVASGQGIDFSATSGTGTSELLADYEEGTWTPNDSSGAGLSLEITGARYTRIGRQVTCTAFLTYPVTASAAAAVIGGLPFSAVGEGGFGVTGYSTAGFQLFLRSNSATSIAFVNNANVATTNVALSTAIIGFSFVYFV
jgi:hypothetical protein